MKTKKYFVDVSRQLLLFALILVGFISEAKAQSVPKMAFPTYEGPLVVEQSALTDYLKKEFAELWENNNPGVTAPSIQKIKYYAVADNNFVSELSSFSASTDYVYRITFTESLNATHPDGNTYNEVNWGSVNFSDIKIGAAIDFEDHFVQKIFGDIAVFSDKTFGEIKAILATNLAEYIKANYPLFVLPNDPLGNSYPEATIAVSYTDETVRSLTDTTEYIPNGSYKASLCIKNSPYATVSSGVLFKDIPFTVQNDAVINRAVDMGKLTAYSGKPSTLSDLRTALREYITNSGIAGLPSYGIHVHNSGFSMGAEITGDNTVVPEGTIEAGRDYSFGYKLTFVENGESARAVLKIGGKVYAKTEYVYQNGITLRQEAVASLLLPKIEVEASTTVDQAKQAIYDAIVKENATAIPNITTIFKKEDIKILDAAGSSEVVDLAGKDFSYSLKQNPGYAFTTVTSTIGGSPISAQDGVWKMLSCLTVAGERPTMVFPSYTGNTADKLDDIRKQLMVDFEIQWKEKNPSVDIPAFVDRTTLSKSVLFYAEDDSKVESDHFAQKGEYYYKFVFANSLIAVYNNKQYNAAQWKAPAKSVKIETADDLSTLQIPDNFDGTVLISGLKASIIKSRLEGRLKKYLDAQKATHPGLADATANPAIDYTDSGLEALQENDLVAKGTYPCKLHVDKTIYCDAVDISFNVVITNQQIATLTLPYVKVDASTTGADAAQQAIFDAISTANNNFGSSAPVPFTKDDIAITESGSAVMVLVPGKEYDYTLTKSPYYDFAQVNSEVGGLNLSDNGMSWTMAKSVKVSTAEQVIKLPAYTGNSALLKADYADEAAVIAKIKADIEKENAEVVVSIEKEANNYKVTIESVNGVADLTQYTFAYQTADGTALQSDGSASYTYMNALEWVDAYSTSRTYKFSQYNVSYTQGLLLSKVCEAIKAQIIAENPQYPANVGLAVGIKDVADREVQEGETLTYVATFTKEAGVFEHLAASADSYQTTVTDLIAEVDGGVVVGARGNYCPDFSTVNPITIPYVKGLAVSDVQDKIREALTPLLPAGVVITDIKLLQNISSLEGVVSTIKEGAENYHYAVTYSFDASTEYGALEEDPIVIANKYRIISGSTANTLVTENSVKITKRPELTLQLKKYTETYTPDMDAVTLTAKIQKEINDQLAAANDVTATVALLNNVNKLESGKTYGYSVEFTKGTKNYSKVIVKDAEDRVLPADGSNSMLYKYENSIEVSARGTLTLDAQTYQAPYGTVGNQVTLKLIQAWATLLQDGITIGMQADELNQATLTDETATYGYTIQFDCSKSSLYDKVVVNAAGGATVSSSGENSFVIANAVTVIPREVKPVAYKSFEFPFKVTGVTYRDAYNAALAMVKATLLDLNPNATDGLLKTDAPIDLLDAQGQGIGNLDENVDEGAVLGIRVNYNPDNKYYNFSVDGNWSVDYPSMITVKTLDTYKINFLSFTEDNDKIPFTTEMTTNDLSEIVKGKLVAKGCPLNIIASVEIYDAVGTGKVSGALNEALTYSYKVTFNSKADLGFTNIEAEPAVREGLTITNDTDPITALYVSSISFKVREAKTLQLPGLNKIYTPGLSKEDLEEAIKAELYKVIDASDLKSFTLNQSSVSEPEEDAFYDYTFEMLDHNYKEVVATAPGVRVVVDPLSNGIWKIIVEGAVKVTARPVLAPIAPAQLQIPYGTDEEAIKKMIIDQVLLSNSGTITSAMIDHVELTPDREEGVPFNYTVQFKLDAMPVYSGVIAKGQNRWGVQEGAIIVARPELKVVLPMFTGEDKLKLEGITKSGVEQAILAKIMLISQNVKGGMIENLTLTDAACQTPAMDPLEVGMYGYTFSFSQAVKDAYKSITVVMNGTENKFNATDPVAWVNSVEIAKDGQSLVKYPLTIRLTLPIYTGQKAFEYGQTNEAVQSAILAEIQSLNASVKDMPVLSNWGAKVSLIDNNSSADVVDITAKYPEVSQSYYGYRFEIDGSEFSKLYKLEFVVSDSPSPSAVIISQNATSAVTKLSLEIKKNTSWGLAQYNAPAFETVYSDQTKAEFMSWLNESLLAKTVFNTLNEKMIEIGAKDWYSLSAETVTDAPDAGDYDYKINIVSDQVKANFELPAGDMTNKVTVKPATIALSMPTFTGSDGYIYGMTKAAIESDMTAKFVAANQEVLNGYNLLSDGKWLNLILGKSSGSIDDIPVVGNDYHYVVNSTLEKEDNFVITVNTSAPGILTKANPVVSDASIVEVRKESISVVLPTMSAYYYGRETKAEILAAIQDAVKANNKLLADAITAGKVTIAISLPGVEEAVEYLAPKAGNDPYAYTVAFTSTEYDFTCTDSEGTEVIANPENTFTLIKGVYVLRPGIVVNFKESDIKANWMIGSGYVLDETLKSATHGFDILTFTETPDAEVKSMTSDRWAWLFENNLLNWALFAKDGTEPIVKGQTLKSVLYDYPSLNLTSGIYEVRLLAIPSGLKMADVAEYTISNDNMAIATLTVTPATIEVKPKEVSYKKTYGVEAESLSDFDEALDIAFNTDNEATIAGIQRTGELFEIFEPTEAYKATAAVGLYEDAIKIKSGISLDAYFKALGCTFVASAETASVTVEKKAFGTDELVVRPDVDREYGEANAAIKVEVTAKDEQNNVFADEIAEVLNKEVGSDWFNWGSINLRTDAGKYYVEFSAKAIAAIEALNNVEGLTIESDSMVISPAPMRAVAPTISLNFGEEIPELKVTYEGFRNNETETTPDVFDEYAEIKTDAVQGSRGTWKVEFTKEAKARNYTIEHVEGQIVIGENMTTEIKWDASDIVLTEGNQEQLTAYVVAANGMIFDKVVKYTLSNNEGQSVRLTTNEDGSVSLVADHRTINDGDILLTASWEGDATYLAPTSITRKVRVELAEGDAKALSFIVSSMAGIYDGTRRAANAIVKDSEGNDVEHKIYYEGYGDTEYVLSTVAPKDAGRYTVTVEARGYKYIAKDRLVILPKNVMLRAESFEITYGEEIPDFSKAYSYDVNEFLGDDDFSADMAPVVTASPSSLKNAGVYSLIAASEQTFQNYAIVSVPGTLTIKKAPLTVKAEDKGHIYGEKMQSLTYVIDGFVNDETVKDLGFAPRINTAATSDSDAGEYAIEVSAPFEAKNYDITYINGVYVIAKAEQEILWEPKSMTLGLDKEITLTAKATSKGKITYTSSDLNVAYVNDLGDESILITVNEGDVTITATQEGTTNYMAASPVSKTFRVSSIATSIEDVDVETVVVYPTLVESNVNVKAPVEISKVEIVSMNGALIKSIEKPETGIDLSELAAGTYAVRVYTSDGKMEVKSIIKK